MESPKSLTPTAHSSSPNSLPPINTFATHKRGDISDQKQIHAHYNNDNSDGDSETVLHSRSHSDASVADVCKQIAHENSQFQYSLNCSGRSLALIVMRIASFLSTPANLSPSPSLTKISSKLITNKSSLRNNVVANAQLNDSAYRGKPTTATLTQETFKPITSGGNVAASNPAPISTVAPSKGRHASPYAPLLQRNNRSQCSQKGLSDRGGVPEMIAMYAINTADKYTTTSDLEEYLSKIGESNVGMTSTGINRSVGSRHSHMKGSHGISRIMNHLGGISMSGGSSKSTINTEVAGVIPSMSSSSLYCTSDDFSTKELSNELNFIDTSFSNNSSPYTVPTAIDKKLPSPSNISFENAMQPPPATNIQAPKSYSTSKLFSLPTLHMTKK